MILHWPTWIGLFAVNKDTAFLQNRHIPADIAARVDDVDAVGLRGLPMDGAGWSLDGAGRALDGAGPRLLGAGLILMPMPAPRISILWPPLAPV